ncbi:MAG: hypothetical protein ACT6T0_04025 [Nevskia sp.]|jgi:hypothetical protein|uniref:hypothetical protein n=1 Tax=Nevskia sp. TaxID=1929292 RepID=UPI0040360849
MRLIATLIMLAAVGTAHAGPTANFFAKGTFTGMQLSIADAEAQGKIPSKAALCLKSLEYSQLLPVYESLLHAGLSSQELAKSDAFYSSGAGKKYAQQGLIQIYTATGHSAPEAMPTLTGRELDDVEEFSRSGAGTKLIKERVLESPEARKAAGEKIQEMVQSCRQRSGS